MSRVRKSGGQCGTAIVEWTKRMWLGFQGRIGWVVLSVFVLAASSGYAQEVGPAPKVLQAVIDRLADGHEQDVIVEFDVGGILSEAAAMRRQAQILRDDANILAFKARRFAALKQDILAALPGREGTLLRDYSHLPLVYVRLRTSGALQVLLNHPAVVAVYENQENFPFLRESLPLISQPQAAAAGHRGAGTTVAVLDTGVEYSLATFGSCTAPGVPASCKVIFAQDFATDDRVLDDDGHGTNVAGIVLGVAPGAKIAALDVFDGKGAPDQAILAAINWSVVNQARYDIAAMNLSLGGQRFSAPCSNSPYTSAFAQARATGIVPTVASGNEEYKDSLSYPACAPGAVSVGAVYDANVGSRTWSRCADPATVANQVTCFSNSASFLTLLAPGAMISVENLVYGGTSQAAPHVAGATAVLKAFKPSASPDEIVSVLQRTGVPTTDPRNSITKPRINVKAALDALADGGGGTPTITSPAPGSTLPGTTVTFQWTANGAPVAEWGLTIGSSPGAYDMYNSGSLGTRLSITLGGFPTDGRPIFVRLYYRLAAGWQGRDFRYATASK
jgi:hypothetical protein